MRKLCSMLWFHLRLYAKNTYFFWLMVSSTISILLLQYVAAYATGNMDQPQIWLRAGIFGLWGSATSAAGSISFQRFQGTLPYILNTATDDRLSLAALLIPAASFGLLSFPLSFIFAGLLGISTAINFHIVTAVLLLWIAAILLDFGIAAIFVLTPNAMVYEDLISIPVLLLAGALGAPKILMPVIEAARWLLPISAPIHMLLGAEGITAFSLLQFTVSAGIWLTISALLGKQILQASRSSGKMGVRS